MNAYIVKIALVVSIITTTVLPIQAYARGQWADKDIFDLAAEYSQYEKTDKRPKIINKSDAAINQKVANRGKYLLCGYYDHKNDTIIFSRSSRFITPLEEKACHVHEAVHFLQFINGRDFSTCFSRKLLEAEAYFVQNKFLSKNNGQKIKWTTRHHRCR